MFALNLVRNIVLWRYKVITQLSSSSSIHLSDDELYFEIISLNASCRLITTAESSCGKRNNFDKRNNIFSQTVQ